MPENSEPIFDLEATFKKILEQPDVVIPAGEIQDGLSKEQRATLQALLEVELPSAEEIERNAKIAVHPLLKLGSPFLQGGEEELECFSI